MSHSSGVTGCTERRLPRWITMIFSSPGACFTFAGPLTEFVLLGNIALRAGKRLRWDGASMRITNDEKADALVRGSYREGWQL